MRLFTVEVSYEMVVYAEDEGNALQVDRDYAREGQSDLSVYDLDMAVRKYPEHGIPTGYDDDCCVYGGGDRRIGDLLHNVELRGGPAVSSPERPA